MKGKGGKKDTNHAYVYMYARERKRQTMDGCHINSGNRCIVPNSESESQTIDSEQRTNAQGSIHILCDHKITIIKKETFIPTIKFN